MLRFWFFVLALGFGLSLSGQHSELEEWLAVPFEERSDLSEENFAQASLGDVQALRAAQLLIYNFKTELRASYLEEWNNRQLEIDSINMPFSYKRFGKIKDEPASLIISLHGGGGAPAELNDQQYKNQQRLYDKFLEHENVLYLTPRAPTNTWNMWHQCHMDQFIETLISMAILEENVNPNRIYLIGYSAGGDGVYQLGTRMADRFSAVSMMAGHPNEVTPMNLRNLPFALHMGAQDSAYSRNQIAKNWGFLLDSLEKENKGNYKHQVKLHKDKGHWMEFQDAEALPWILKYEKIKYPTNISWKQDDCHRTNFYCLEIPQNSIQTGGEIEASINLKRNEINIEAFYGDTLIINLNDKILDLNKPVTVSLSGKPYWSKTLQRNMLNIDYVMRKNNLLDGSYYCSRIRLLRLENGEYDVHELSIP